tara:strand:- start:5527 stop:5631 length:105 start_codon:yes stop_codon:yes gene_type:complete
MHDLISLADTCLALMNSILEWKFNLKKEVKILPL